MRSWIRPVSGLWLWSRLGGAAGALALVALLTCLAPAGAQRRQEPRPRFHGRTGVVTNSTAYPWSAVCKIIAIFPDGTAEQGAGTMIGPHHCLTALHLLYHRSTRESADHVRIIPGYDEERGLADGLDSHPFGTTHVNQYLYWEPQDIAVIVTSTNIGAQSSWMTVGTRSDRELLNQSYFLAGYPRVEPGPERQGSMTTSILRVDGDRLDINADAPEGMNGGPIFELTSHGAGGELDTWSIVGIQTAPNRGVRIPADMRLLLRKFLHDDYSITKARIPVPIGSKRRAGGANRDAGRLEDRPKLKEARGPRQDVLPRQPAEQRPYP